MERDDRVMEQAIANLLGEIIGSESWKTDENFKDTPKRVVKMYRECLHGYENFDEKLKMITKSVFPSNNKEMVVVSDMTEYTFCPHHLQPVFLSVAVGYIPNNLVLGISKIPRLVRLLSSRLVLQEDLTDEVSDFLMKSLKPKGVITLVEGRHCCMTVRGVKSSGHVTTSSVRGIFEKNKDAVKEEFFSLVGRSKL